MDERSANARAVIAQLLGEGSLQEWLVAQRWFASKSHAVRSAELIDAAVLEGEPALAVALVQVEFASRDHQIYQVPLGLSTGPMAPEASLGRIDDRDVVDAMLDTALARALLERLEAESRIQTARGLYSFLRVEGGAPLGSDRAPRLLAVEQSNTSVVFGEEIMLKVFRRLEPGINPELEMLRFLTAHGFDRVAELYAWYEYEGQRLAATLGVAQRYVTDAVGGWEFALAEIASNPNGLLERLAELGSVTGHLHTTLASDSGDPAFAPEQPSAEWVELLTATIDEEIERIFLALPSDDRLAPIAGRGPEVRDRLAMRRRVGLSGRLIRTHGDYHLAQTLHSPAGWFVIDFEGEPVRPLSERRRKRSALRDVAGMMRSFAYLAEAAARAHSARRTAGFEAAARGAFLDAYVESIDPMLLPAGRSAIDSLLSIFELERAMYELQYELDHRPDWVPIPVAGVSALLEAP